MKKKVFALLLAWSVFFASMAEPITEVKVWAGETEGDTSEEIRRGILPNGLTYKVKGDGTMAIIKFEFLGEKEIEVPETINTRPVTSIEEHVFEGCKDLEKIKLPKGLEKIGVCAFRNCDSLTELIIPSSVTEIHETSLSGCDNLQSIILEEGNKKYTLDDNGILYGRNQTYLFACPGGKTGHVNIPEGVTRILFVAFEDCKGLTGITLPDSLEEIKSNAFWGCSSLEEVTIPESVSVIWANSFSGSGLVRVTIPSSVTWIGASAFGYCSKLTDVFYQGTKEQWRMVEVQEGNEPILKAVIHCTDGIVGEEEKPEDKNPDNTEEGSDSEENTQKPQEPGGVEEIHPKPEENEEPPKNPENTEENHPDSGENTKSPQKPDTETGNQEPSTEEASEDSAVPALKVELSVKNLPSSKKIYLAKGKSQTLTAKLFPADTTDTLAWSSSKPSVVSVKNGRIKGKKSGTAKITATSSSGKKASCTVTVLSRNKKSVSVKLNKKSITLKKGKSYYLKASLKPANSTDTVKWKSSDKKVASVDSYGCIKAKKKGKTTVTVITKSGKKASCKVTVK